MIFWWPDMLEDIEKKSKTCSACLNAGKNLKFQIPQTEKKTKTEPPKTPGEEIQLDFTGNLHNKKLPSTPYILVAVITFLKKFINIYGVPKQIKSDKRRRLYLKRIQRILQNAKYQIHLRYRQLTYRHRIGRTHYLII